jgi:two-component system response regulator AtoC
MDKNLNSPHSNSKGLKQFGGVIGKSPAMLEIAEKISKVSLYKTTVLLNGESGTGKELIAKYIHENSPRKGKPFIPINCGAIPEHLIESELFGHKKGAFTDATRDKKGLFEEASNGTIFLDEIGELPLHLQAKLLRVLQESTIRPVGSENSTEIDVRIISATLRDLEKDSMNGKFRDDLFYRLNVLTLRIPPLRERIEDLPELTDYLLEKISKKLNLKKPTLSEEAKIILSKHTWPGNIRELENYLERAAILTENELIDVDVLPKKIVTKVLENSNHSNTSNLPDNLSIKEHTKIIEKDLILRALKQTSGNKTHAAKLLEISHRTLLYKLKEYNFDSSLEE